MSNKIRHLIFIRHGQSEHHVKGLTGGWTDTPLTQLGRNQMTMTAKKLRDWKLRKVKLYCSDLKRAVESAEIVGSELGYEPIALPELREIGNGDAAGLSLQQAAQIQVPEPKTANLDWRPYKNAETWREMSIRIGKALNEFSDRVDTVLVVGHGNSGQALATTWLGLPVACKIAFQFSPASISEFKVNQWGEREILHVNLIYNA